MVIFTFVLSNKRIWEDAFSLWVCNGSFWLLSKLGLGIKLLSRGLEILINLASWAQ